MFFDIDCEDTNVDKDVLLSEIVDAILNYLKIEENIIYPMNRIVVINGHKDTKISYHLIFPDIAVPNMDTMKIIAENIKSCMNDYKEYIDCSYMNQKNFRLLFNTKRGSKAFLKFQKKWTYIGTVEDKEEEIEFDFMSSDKKLEFTLMFEYSIIQCFSSVNTVIQSKNKKDDTSVPLITDDEIQEILNNVKLPKGLEIANSNENIVHLVNKEGYDCPKCNRRHENQNPYLFIKKDLLCRELWFNCRRNKESLLMSKIDNPDIFKEDVEDSSSNIVFGYLKEPKFTKTYSEKYCLPITVPENMIYFLSAGLGKGKTKVMIDFMKEKINEHPNIKILILSPRQIFASSLLNRINQDNLDFECYLNLKPSEYDYQKRFIVQMESLQHVNTNYDMIIIDEIESCLAQFESSETMKYHLKSCANNFQRLIKSSTYVFCCDAFLSTKSTQVISRLSNKKRIVCKNTSPLVKRKAIEYDTIMSLIESLMMDLKLNKKIFFVSASKEKVDYLEKLILKHLPEKKYKIYHSSSKEKITNVNEDWKNVDLVIVSPSVTVGVNYELEDFDLLYLYGSPNSCCVRDIFQSSMRVRHIKENVMKFSVCKAFQSNRKDENVFSLKNIAKKLLEDKKIQKDFHQSNIQEQTDDISGSLTQNWIDMCDWMMWNKIYTIQEKNQSKSFYKRVFYYYLGLCNYDYDMDEQIRLESKINLYEFEKKIKYDDIPDVKSSDEAKEIMKKIKDDPESYLSVLKFNFSRLMKIDELVKTENHMKLDVLFNEYLNPVSRNKFYNLKKEKKDYESIDRNDLIQNVFWENSNKSAMKTFKIKELNSILGIRNSCEAKILSVEETTDVIDKIYPKYDELCRIFKIREQNLKSSSECDKEHRDKVKYILSEVYKKWNGCKLRCISKKVMKNKVREKVYLFEKEICGFNDKILSSLLR
jgi:hypothetical protein